MLRDLKSLNCSMFYSTYNMNLQDEINKFVLIYTINLQEWYNQPTKPVISYHKDASHCCARVAAADWFTCRLVLESLTTSEN